LLAASLAAARTPQGASEPLRLGSDVYVTGSELTWEAAVPGDAVIAAGSAAVNGSVGGDALVAGGNVSIDSSVGQDLYVAGGDVRVSASIGDSARIAGGRVTIAPDAEIAGGATLAGGRVALDGHVGRYAVVRAGRTVVNGRIGGDLRVVGRELSLGPDAVVEGRLEYRGTEPLRMAAGARVHGGIAETARQPAGAVPHGAWIAWLVAWILAGAALLALAPQASRSVTRALRTRPVASPLLGVALLLGLPLLALVLIATVIGLPLGVLTVSALLALVALGHLATAVTLGDWVVERRGPAKTWQRALATALALTLLFALARLPYVGWLVWLLALLFGMGAIALAAVGVWRSPPAPAR
jgi:hypothetical protein